MANIVVNTEKVKTHDIVNIFHPSINRKTTLGGRQMADLRDALQKLEQALAKLVQEGHTLKTEGIYRAIPPEVLQPFTQYPPELVSKGGDNLKCYLRALGNIVE